MPSSDPAPLRPAVFGALPPNARILPIWATALIAIGFTFAAQLGAIPAIVVLAVGAAAGGFPPVGEAALLFGMILPIFAPLILLVAFWTRVFERRPLASIGLAPKGAVWRYGRGYLFGLVLGVALLGLGAVFAPEDMAGLGAGAARLLNGGGVLFLVALAIMFGIQSAAEEITFRGWLLSAVAARRGAVAGIVATSIAFGAVHLQYAFFAPLTGILVMTAVGLMGAVFAFMALTERSVWGACGAHGAYNFLATGVSIATALARQPDATPPGVALETFLDLTTLTEWDPSLPATLALMAAVVAVFCLLWRRSLRRASAAGLLAD